MRVSISGSPASARCAGSGRSRDRWSRAGALAAHSVGVRDRTAPGRPSSGIRRPGGPSARNPLPQQTLPPSGAFSPESRTTKPGRSRALAAESVREPGPHARPAGHLAAGVHEDLAGRVVELRRVHRAHDGDVVGDRRQVRQQLRQLGAGLAVPLERERRAEQLRHALDEREPLALEHELRRDSWPSNFCSFGL